MNQEKKQIDIDAIQDITVQLINIAKRMELIEDLHGTARGIDMEHVIVETVRDIAADAADDVRMIFRLLDGHTNVREFMDRLDLECAFPKEVHDGSKNQREEAR